MPLPRPTRDAYRRLHPMTTRIADNDMYGHMNNVTYYEYFDSAVNWWLIEKVGLSLPNGDVIGIVADTQCSFMAEVKWPVDVEVGMRIDRIGRTSLVYGLAMFSKGEELAHAACRYVHVYVKNPERRPTPLPEKLVAEARAIAGAGCEDTLA
ncbi:acyl-CoA thioesterase [Rhodovulum sp. DZ06]|uniref:acyl-CoA thioesterase n=1 Tax=Rhodovulum sp. DZ06 TaxID=3425126 RepID=UPI003D3252AE